MITYRHLARTAALLAAAGLAVAGFAMAARVQPGAAARSTVDPRVLSSTVRAMSRARNSVPQTVRRPQIVNRSSANSQTYTDPTGDSGNAPDVTTVTVSNDDSGLITITAGVPNRTSLGGADLILVAIDSDQNAATGYDGLDYALGLGPGVSVFLAWNGSTLSPSSAPSYSASFTGSQAVFRINRSDLGNTNGFSFALGASGDNGNTTPEVAGLWGYQVVIEGTTTTTTTPATTTDTTTTADTTTTSTTTTTATTTTPTPVSLTKGPLQLSGDGSLNSGKAYAGKPFRAGMLVLVADDTQAPAHGQVSCPARIAGKALRVLRNDTGYFGTAICVWQVPRKTRGKLLKGSVIETYQGATVSSSFSVKVR